MISIHLFERGTDVLRCFTQLTSITSKLNTTYDAMTNNSKFVMSKVISYANYGGRPIAIRFARALRLASASLCAWARALAASRFTSSRSRR